MAVRIFSDDPQALLQAIKGKIDAGRITTWAYERHGYFLHTAPQWRSQAWLRPRILPDQLMLTIVPPKGKAVSRVAYAVYHGRFIEMVLSHFDHSFTKATATALPTSDDQVASRHVSDD